MTIVRERERDRDNDTGAKRQAERGESVESKIQHFIYLDLSKAFDAVLKS